MNAFISWSMEWPMQHVHCTTTERIPVFNLIRFTYQIRLISIQLISFILSFRSIRFLSPNLSVVICCCHHDMPRARQTKGRKCAVRISMNGKWMEWLKVLPVGRFECCVRTGLSFGRIYYFDSAQNMSFGTFSSRFYHSTNKPDTIHVHAYHFNFLLKHAPIASPLSLRFHLVDFSIIHWESMEPQNSKNLLILLIWDRWSLQEYSYAFIFQRIAI